ncbi:MAG TPA: ATP-binding protein [Marmoricola sp.]|nr:ATP-binding protein [Marmoricola sp.]
MTAQPLPHPGTESLRVVIIDDTADLRELLRFALVRGGMSVVGEAGDGRAGIEVVAETMPDVVLLDLSMPVMDGLEALPTIRGLVPASHIIVLSGFGATQMAERALDLGANGYLEKGASLGRVLDHIRDIVDGRTTNPIGRALTPTHESPLRAAPGPEASRVPAQRDTAEAPGEVWDALTLAPFGIVEVGAEPPFRILRINPAAEELLHDAGQPEATRPGTPFSVCAGDIAATITNNRLRGDIDFEAVLDWQPINVNIRHTGTSLLVYLRTITEEVGVLRSAIATTAHEIRGPVAVLCAIAEAISEDDLSPEELQRLIASVARQARMLDGITADLLTAAQIQRGTLRMDLRDVDPAVVAEAVIVDHDVTAATLEISDRRRVRADPLRLSQMISNLVSNATKYGQPPIWIRVRPSTEDGHGVCIDIQDAGPGVPVEFRSKLFREFSRASGTAAAGTGLGLHVVRTLAVAHGGTIGYAAGEHGGSVFTLTLPAAARD